MELVLRLFDLSYLLEPRPGPIGGLAWLYLPLALLFAAQLVATPRRGAPVALAAAGLLLVGARLANVPYVAARLWVVLVAALLVGYHLRARLPAQALRETAGRLWAALTWREVEGHSPPALVAAQWLVHLAGMALVFASMGWPLGWALLALGTALLLTGYRRPELLAPLAYLYLVVFVREWARLTYRQPLPLHNEFHPPGLAATLYNVDGAALVALAWAAGAWLIGRLGWARARTYGPSLLLAAGLLWGGWTYLRHATTGVTGSDPYAYAQMAVDLASRGTPLHRFKVFQEIGELKVPWAPLLPPGYHLPINTLGDAPTVWPVGGSVILALPYLLTGERGLYLATPLIALLAAAAVYGLGRDLLGRRAAALSAVLLLTSFELLDRSVVPMADAGAVLLTVLAVWAAWRRQPVWAGLALAAAYHVRHTQVIAALPIAVVLWPGAGAPGPAGGDWRRLGLTAATALVGVLPDLGYHWAVFGHPLALESQELKHFSLAAAPFTYLSVLRGLLQANEFGYLWPAMLVGLFALRRQARLLWLLVAWLAGHVLFQLWYTELRPRDLLPAWPALLYLASAGLLWGFGSWRGWARLAAVFLLVALPAYRTRDTLARAWIPFEASFGYVNAVERRGFDELEAMLGEGALVGTSLNSGPIELYTSLTPFRADGWTPAELAAFLAWVDRPAYIVLDGEGLRPVLQELAVEGIGQVELPYFGRPKADAGTVYRIERP